MALLRFVDTVRRLRPKQTAALIRHRLRSRIETLDPIEDIPPTPEIRAAVDFRFIPPPTSTGVTDFLQNGVVTFLNQKETVGWPPTWDVPHLPMLWQYHLHYHDLLWDLPFEEGRAFAVDWIRRYPNARGRAGWDPYPISLRIQNWCMYFFGRYRVEALANAADVAELWNSTFVQLSWLEKHVERHLLGNHILENGAAFAFAGATFGGPSGDRWLEIGLNLLREHLDEVVLPDGGHIERSPMYQARLCQMLENLARTGHTPVVQTARPHLGRARMALAHLTHTDGNIALLNDAGFGVYPGMKELGIDRPDAGSFALPVTGYFGARTPAGHYVVCDAAPIGPDYQPGHAHGDILSFELSIDGLRFVVDSGVYGYERDAWRHYARSTRAHNTVEINRLDQCEFWAAFRVGRRAYPRRVEHLELDDGFSLGAEHDGYEHLPGHPVHHRQFRWHDDGVLMVRDRIHGEREVWTRSHLHLHPDVSIEPQADGSVRLTRAHASCTIGFAGAGRLLVEPSWYFPEFGLRLANSVLVVTEKGSDVSNGFCIAAGRNPPRLDLREGAVVSGKKYGW